MTEIKKAIRVGQWDVLYILAFQGGAFLLGVAMVLIINRFANDDPSYACMGTLMSICGALGGELARGNVFGQTRFSMAVSMGQTRRSFLVGEVLTTAALMVAPFAVAFGLYQLEQFFYRKILWPGFTNELPFDGFFQWWVLLLLMAGTVLASLFFSAVQLRFGAKGMGIFWFLVGLSAMVIPQSVNRAIEGGDSLFARLGGGILWLVRTVPVPAWIAIGVLVVLLMLAFSIQCHRKAEVRV